MDLIWISQCNLSRRLNWGRKSWGSGLTVVENLGVVHDNGRLSMASNSNSLHNVISWIQLVMCGLG